MESVDSYNLSHPNFETMTERQQLEYLKQHASEDLEQHEPDKRSIVLDYHKYYLTKKKQNQSKISKQKLLERQKLIKLSEKEYIPIKKNEYIERKKDLFFDEDLCKCSCEVKMFTQKEADEIIKNNYEGYTEDQLFGCGAKCLNKYVYWECTETQCKCGISCRNRKFQKHEYADVYPIKTENRGWGLCAGTFIPKDTFIMQYIGEIYSLNSEYGKKKVASYTNKTCTYLMNLVTKNHEVIDPTTRGNMARFINHSCDPNCETRKWHVCGELCIGIFSIKDIQENEELTFNYDFDLGSTTYQRCLCGAPNCRGFLGLKTEDNQANLENGIICAFCNENCTQSEKKLVCAVCKNNFHHRCGLKKGQYSSTKGFKCGHCIKKETKNSDEEEKDKVKIRFEEEPIYDENIEVDYDTLRKIKKNLGQLVNLGAGIYWDYQSEKALLNNSLNNSFNTPGIPSINNINYLRQNLCPNPTGSNSMSSMLNSGISPNNTIELKISGTTKQVESVKAKIKMLSDMKDENPNEFTVKVEVPKIYMRKIIGHQSRNLNSFKSKYCVEIEYDQGLITDDIFQIQESTFIEIKGKENSVRAVESQIKTYEYKLKIMTIYLLTEEFFYIRSNICSLKTAIDPADLRLRKYDNTKAEREIKHPFYYLPNYNKDIVIIGFEDEIIKANDIIKATLLRQNNLTFNYSLSFLFPVYFMLHLQKFLNDNTEYTKSKKLRIEKAEPSHPRKHITVIITGKWNEIIELKRNLWDYAKKLITDTEPKRHDIKEFEQYVYNQEHKLVSKNLKTYIIEQNPQIKNWDYISEDINILEDNYLAEELVAKNKKEKLDKIDKKEIEKDLKNDVLSDFIKTVDKETALNYLLAMHPGSYKTVFKMNQNELISDLLDVVRDNYRAYENNKFYDMDGNASNNALSMKTNNTNFPLSLSRVYSENKLSQIGLSTHENKSELSVISSPNNLNEKEKDDIKDKFKEINMNNNQNINQSINPINNANINTAANQNYYSTLLSSNPQIVNCYSNIDFKKGISYPLMSNILNLNNKIDIQQPHSRIESANPQYISYNFTGINNNMNVNINNFLPSQGEVRNISSTTKIFNSKNDSQNKEGDKSPNESMSGRHFYQKQKHGFISLGMKNLGNVNQHDMKRDRDNFRERIYGKERERYYDSRRDRPRDKDQGRIDQHESIPNLSNTASAINPKNSGTVKDFGMRKRIKNRSRSRSRSNSPHRCINRYEPYEHKYNKYPRKNYEKNDRNDKQGFYSKNYSRFHDEHNEKNDDKRNRFYKMAQNNH